MTGNLPAFHQQSTTNSPAKNHVLHPVFAKTPSKNGAEAEARVAETISFLDRVECAVAKSNPR
jgi:hypothetical protein